MLRRELRFLWGSKLVTEYQAEGSQLQLQHLQCHLAFLLTSSYAKQLSGNLFIFTLPFIVSRTCALFDAFVCVYPHLHIIGMTTTPTAHIAHDAHYARRATHRMTDITHHIRQPEQHAARITYRIVHVTEYTWHTTHILSQHAHHIQYIAGAPHAGTVHDIHRTQTKQSAQ